MIAPARPAPLGPTLWWTRPYVFLATITVPTFVILVAAAHQVITTNQAGYTSPDFITPGFVGLFLLGLAAFGAASLWAATLPPVGSRITFANGTLDVLFWPCIAAYLVWFGPIIVADPVLVLGALTGKAGATYDIRALNLNVSGITSLTQFGIAYTCVYGVKRFCRRERLPARYGLYLAVLLALALFRAVVNSERIALLELIFPLIVISGRAASRYRLPLRLLYQLFPLLTIFGSTILFAVFEYNRSWLIHYQYLYDNIFHFAFDRLVIYYVSSFNNICGFMADAGWPTLSGSWTFTWAYHLPGLSSLFEPSLADSRAELFNQFLKNRADEEYNNMTGVLTAYDDWGVAFGTLFLAALGFLAGRAYRSYESGRGVMQYVFPIFCYHVFEILRIGYLYEGRAATALIGLSLALLIGGRRERRSSISNDGALFNAAGAPGDRTAPISL